MIVYFFFFFFQAEDGIRDYKVTGVQTCALPICLDAMWQLIGFYLTWLRLPGRGRALGAGEVKFTGEVGPDVKLVTYEINIKRVIKRKLNMAIGDARLLADGKEIYVANEIGRAHV